MSRKNHIEELINKEFTPIYLNVEDESAKHHVPEGAQTHFKVTVVTSHFEDLTPIARHRRLNHILRQEFDLGLHALSMHLFTPEEWKKKKKTVLKSPACRDGFNQ